MSSHLELLAAILVLVNSTENSNDLLICGERDRSRNSGAASLSCFNDLSCCNINGNESKVDNICVYDDGVLVGGTEPDGSTPVIDEPTTGTTGGDILYGDANCDETVDISDAVMILQALANNDKYGISGIDPSHITAQGMKNADCSSSGDGVTTRDALAVQKYVVGLITLPEE